MKLKLHNLGVYTKCLLCKLACCPSLSYIVRVNMYQRVLIFLRNPHELGRFLRIKFNIVCPPLSQTNIPIWVTRIISVR